MGKTLADKMLIKPGMRVYRRNAPEELDETLLFPGIQPVKKLSGKFDHIHLFVTSLKEFEKEFPRLKQFVSPEGSIWVSWPKAGKMNTDLSMKVIIKSGYDSGMVESICLSVSEDWSGIKFTHPRKGKVYQNSYGKLPGQT